MKESNWADERPFRCVSRIVSVFSEHRQPSDSVLNGPSVFQQGTEYIAEMVNIEVFVYSFFIIFISF
jgi:hypothetical protein